MSNIIVETAVVKSACNTAINVIGKWRKQYREKQIAEYMDTTLGSLWWKRKPTIEEAINYVDGGMCAKMDCWEFLHFQSNYWAEKWEDVISTSNRLLNMCKLADKIELSSEDAAFVGRWIDINSLS